MSAIDAINLNNPFAMQSVTPYTGGTSTPRVNPFEQEPKVGGVGQPQGSALAGFKAEKWETGLGGLKTGALGEEGAVYSKLPGGKETRLGARLNVDAFSVC